MSKFNKVKNIKNMVSSLDIDKLYKLQEYVSVSQEFFKEFDSLVSEYCNLFGDDFLFSPAVCDSDFAFVCKSIELYRSLKDELDVK